MTSNEYYFGLPNGNVVNSRSVTRAVPSGRWDSKSVLSVKGVPGKLTMSVEEEIDIEAMPKPDADGDTDQNPIQANDGQRDVLDTEIADAKCDDFDNI